MDAINRRDRFSRKPNGSIHEVTERDVEWLAFIHRHGGRLPTSYIHEFTAVEYGNLQATQVRLKHLFHELKLLERPFQQKETDKPRSNEIVHQISKEGLNLLKDEGVYSEYSPTMFGAFKHQVFQSCVSASLELNTLGTEFLFTPQHELGKDITMHVNGDKVTPDLVCMLTKGKKNLLLFVEVDRGTEATISSNPNRKSWNRSVKHYKKIIGDGLYKNHFGIDAGALLLVITISKAKQDGILSVVKKEFPGNCNYILTQSIPEFGRAFKPPKQLDLLGTYWERHAPNPFKFL